MEDSKTIILRLRKATDEMLAAAKKERWDLVQKIEEQRSTDITLLFTNHPISTLSEEQARELQSILESNSHLVEIANGVKSEFFNVVLDSLQQTKAVQEYERHKGL